LKRPVQVVASQSSSQNHDRLSAGALGRMAALPGAGGLTSAWSMRVSTADGLGSALSRLGSRSAPDDLGRNALDGSVPPYSIENVKIEAVRAELPFAPGYMRGSPQREFAFFTESFIDELAHAAGMEPLAFRMSMLGQNGRLARCLQGAARLAQWDGGGAGSTMGIAGCSAFGSHIGLVASGSIGADQRVKVERLVAAVDCGRVVNSGLVTQQIEAGLIWALGQATVLPPEWVAGMRHALRGEADAGEHVGELVRTLRQGAPDARQAGGSAGRQAERRRDQPGRRATCFGRGIFEDAQDRDAGFLSGPEDGSFRRARGGGPADLSAVRRERA